MKTKKGTLPVVLEVSHLTCDFTDNAGNGIVGFTVTYSDGTFKNITLPFCPETHAAVQAEIIAIRQIMENSIVALQVTKPKNNKNQTKCNNNKRSLS